MKSKTRKCSSPPRSERKWKRILPPSPDDDSKSRSSSHQRSPTPLKRIQPKRQVKEKPKEDWPSEKEAKEQFQRMDRDKMFESLDFEPALPTPAEEDVNVSAAFSGDFMNRVLDASDDEVSKINLKSDAFMLHKTDADRHFRG